MQAKFLHDASGGQTSRLEAQRPKPRVAVCLFLDRRPDTPEQHNRDEVLAEKIMLCGGDALRDGEKRYVTRDARTTMPAIDFIGMSAREKAAKRYPFSAKRNRIFGDGGFPLVIKCRVPWTIKLYRTAQEREHGRYSTCGAGRCSFNHHAEAQL
jgi:hypothetical protein